MALIVAASALSILFILAYRAKTKWKRRIITYFEGGSVPHNDLECVGDVQDALNAVIAKKGHPIIEASSNNCETTITLTWLKIK